MQLTGAQILIQTLIEQGVTDVFGYPGGQVINIYDALYEYKDQINHVLTAVTSALIDEVIMSAWIPVPQKDLPSNVMQTYDAACEEDFSSNACCT